MVRKTFPWATRNKVQAPMTFIADVGLDNGADRTIGSIQIVIHDFFFLPPEVTSTKDYYKRHKLFIFFSNKWTALYI